MRKEVDTDDTESVGDSKDEKGKHENSFVKRGKNQLTLKTVAVKNPSLLDSEKEKEHSVNPSKNQNQKFEIDVDADSGTNDARLIDKPKATDPNLIDGASTGNSKSDTLPPTKEAREEIDTKDQSSPLSLPMALQKVAPNKLVVSGSKRKADNGIANGAPCSKEPSDHLTRFAFNKLVAPGACQKLPALPTGRLKHYHGPRAWQKTKKRPPPMSRNPHSNPKRIAIEVSNKTTDVLDDSTDADSTANRESSLEQTEKLTDFAYRETSRRVQRGNESKSLKWSANGNASGSKSTLQQSKGRPIRRNMGLVRVQPNMDKTPICRKFLRGIICTDQYCKKRHDVPKEFAMPVCSFFQRHGNCLKGESCPFRHIKVNPRAMVCPSFVVLGFCDDPECKMKHERTTPRNK